MELETGVIPQRRFASGKFQIIPSINVSLLQIWNVFGRCSNKFCERVMNAFKDATRSQRDVLRVLNAAFRTRFFN